MGKGKLVFVLIVVVLIGAVYAAGLGDELLDITGNAVKKLVAENKDIAISKAKEFEKEVAKSIEDKLAKDKFYLNLTSPLTGEKIEYTCEKGLK